MVSEVFNTMVSLADEGMSMLVVTHEMGFANRADEIVFMADGSIIESNAPDEFFANPKSEYQSVPG